MIPSLAVVTLRPQSGTGKRGFLPMRENPRLLWGAAAPRLVVVEPARPGGTWPPPRGPGLLPDGPGSGTGLPDLAGPAGARQPGIAGYLFLRRRNPVLPSPLSLKLQYLASPEPSPGKPGVQGPSLRGHLRAVLRRTCGNHPDHSQSRPADYLSSPGGLCSGRWRVPGSGGPGPILGISLPVRGRRQVCRAAIPRAATSISV